jgi:EAL domain-containing protein (putative c-di-GMP-specific phosphodiesterase class I)
MKFREADIQSGFAQDEFFPVFQPLVELRTGQLVGFEALARWRNKKLGLVSPDDFIPVMEQSGLIDRLTTVILEKAFNLRVLKESALSLSVNISPGQLLGPNTAERLMSIAGEGCFPLNRLIIEITESALLDDLERAQAVALELKAMKCKLALDDFGTGYSSLSYLKRFPIDIVKIDQGFIEDVAQNRSSHAIVSAVIELAHALDMTVITEGVETAEQHHEVAALGSESCQGFYFARPMSASSLDALARQATVLDLRLPIVV